MGDIFGKLLLFLKPRWEQKMSPNCFRKYVDFATENLWKLSEENLANFPKRNLRRKFDIFIKEIRFRFEKSSRFSAEYSWVFFFRKIDDAREEIYLEANPRYFLLRFCDLWRQLCTNSRVFCDAITWRKLVTKLLGNPRFAFLLENSDHRFDICDFPFISVHKL